MEDAWQADVAADERVTVIIDDDPTGAPAPEWEEAYRSRFLPLADGPDSEETP